MDIEQRLKAWRDSEAAASDAEDEAGRIGQAAQDPRAAEVLRRASTLRQRADRMLADLLDFVHAPRSR